MRFFVHYETVGFYEIPGSEGEAKAKLVEYIRAADEHRVTHYSDLLRNRTPAPSALNPFLLVETGIVSGTTEIVSLVELALGKVVKRLDPDHDAKVVAAGELRRVAVRLSNALLALTEELQDAKRDCEVKRAVEALSDFRAWREQYSELV